MSCFKPAWDHAFTAQRNLDGWRVEGMIPFTRYALWRKRGAPCARSQNSDPGEFGESSQTHALLGAMINAPVGTSGVGPIVPYLGMRPPFTKSFMPKPIREAFDCFEKDEDHNTSSEQTKEELLRENMKMKE